MVGEIQLHRALGIDRDVVQAGRELLLLNALTAERARDVVAARHLGDDRAHAAARGDEPERGGHRRLAHPALAGDDHEVAVEQGQTSPSQ